METDIVKTKRIRKQIILKLSLSIPVMCIVFFLPARTINYWEALVYMGIIFTGVAVTISYFLKHDPELLERRMRTKENVKEQKLIIKISMILFLPAFVMKTATSELMTSAINKQ
jgi:Ca2+/Na+ antiporter